MRRFRGCFFEVKMHQVELAEAARLEELYAAHVNPQWVRLLDLLRMNVRYTRCVGAELQTENGDCILDFLSGYCVHNLGHNHPAVVAALKRELDECGPAMLQSHVSELAGELAARLCELAGGGLNKVYFCSSGSEGVETAIKFARAHTQRQGLLACSEAFHGLSCGALSLMDNAFWRANFGPLLAGVEIIPFNDVAALARSLATRQHAAFIVEPIQSEAGVRLPEAGYLAEAQELCRRYGTLFVLDEVQTGMYRSGHFLAAHQYSVQPDMVVMAKALSGGLVPVGAVLMTEAVNHSVYKSLQRATVHTSTYSENSLAMRAGLATLQVMREENLGAQSRRMGEYLRNALAESLSGYEMVREVRGSGMLNVIEFQAPRKLTLRVPFEAFRAVHGAMFGQILVMRLFREKKVLTQVCGNNFMALKVAPPLVISESQADTFVRSVREVVDLVHSSGSFWSEALQLAARAVNI